VRALPSCPGRRPSPQRFRRHPLSHLACEADDVQGCAIVAGNRAFSPMRFPQIARLDCTANSWPRARLFPLVPRSLQRQRGLS
jgi:hypothetical protein